MYMDGVCAAFLQFVSILPDIVQSNNVGMFKQFHDRNLALQTIRDRPVTRSTGHTALGTLDEVGQTLCASVFGSCSCDDLDRTILMSCFVPDHSDA